ncbi:cell envelope-related function transcriptional attenuator common domain protein [Paraoerskovia sediminicola]|uniref:Cell envelope-related function transcriptional attenuator common domain protein n=1 Tax=Paraoerskovia sediminicola TaxID=1138587 RepID=A0ABM8G467_9CELL|nr:LCP family protein [Paraoerskovia sediminicola]BDZ42839.1 cell envelope-related function transcriptional attenuator common domain protein [Paraoerskovia sediminicola]
MTTDPSDTAPRASRGPSHARTLARHNVGRRIAMALTGVLAFVAVGGVAVAASLTGNITTEGVTEAMRADVEKPPPTDPDAGEPLNILLLGSDYRGGENTDFAVDGVTGMRSDTAIVAHVSADRERVELVSIPRDSMVDRPECTATDGTAIPGGHDLFNSAFAYGADRGGDIASAAACSMNTISTLTDLYIDDYVVVDFAGFEKMVDAIGGVPICIPEAIDDPKADLDIEAGEQTLDGADALGFARVRYGVGDGSDLSRIGRQQQLLAATMRQVLGKNLLTDAPALFDFLTAATSSLTVSDGLGSITDLTGLAYSLRGIGPDSITFMTIPNAADPADPNRVVWTSEADDVWERLVADEPVTGEPEPTSEPTATDEPTEGSDEATDGSETDAATDDESSEPQETKDAGKEAFTSDDVTAVCG